METLQKKTERQLALKKEASFCVFYIVNSVHENYVHK